MYAVLNSCCNHQYVVFPIPNFILLGPENLSSLHIQPEEILESKGGTDIKFL